MYDLCGHFLAFSEDWWQESETYQLTGIYIAHMDVIVIPKNETTYCGNYVYWYYINKWTFHFILEHILCVFTFITFESKTNRASQKQWELSCIGQLISLWYFSDGYILTGDIALALRCYLGVCTNEQCWYKKVILASPNMTWSHTESLENVAHVT